MRDSLLIIGPVLNVLCIIPYLVSMVRGNTKPNIATWLTWTILTGIGAAAVIVSDGWGEALLPAGASLVTLSVVLLGLKYGYAEYGKFDITCQILAIVGLSMWFIFNSPLVGLIAVIVIDAIAGLPTIRHGWRKPFEETWQTFAIGSAASFITFLGLTELTITNIAFPIYLSLANGIIAAAIILGRRRVTAMKN